MNWINLIFSLLASIISGMVLLFLQKNTKKREENEDRLEKAGVKEKILIIKSINALGNLTHANAIAIRDGKTNGEMHEATENYIQVKEELYDYLLEQNAKK